MYFCILAYQAGYFSTFTENNLAPCQHVYSMRAAGQGGRKGAWNMRAGGMPDLELTGILLVAIFLLIVLFLSASKRLC
jgi:hypothetical protein